MYNGIGLPTPRGSGTSGYIQRNLSYAKPRRSDFELKAKNMFKEQPPKIKKPNLKLIEHERKRKIEIQLLTLKDQLEKEKIQDTIIKKRLKEERERLNDEYDKSKKTAEEELDRGLASNNSKLISKRAIDKRNSKHSPNKYSSKNDAASNHLEVLPYEKAPW